MDLSKGTSVGRGRLGDDVEVLVDIEESVGVDGTVDVVPPLADARLLAEDGAVVAQKRVNQTVLAAVVPHLFR